MSNLFSYLTFVLPKFYRNNESKSSFLVQWKIRKPAKPSMFSIDWALFASLNFFPRNNYASKGSEQVLIGLKLFLKRMRLMRMGNRANCFRRILSFKIFIGSFSGLLRMRDFSQNNCANFFSFRFMWNLIFIRRFLLRSKIHFYVQILFLCRCFLNFKI